MPVGQCKHFMGATYELTQKNMQRLILELEEAQAEIKRLKENQFKKDSFKGAGWGDLR